MPVADINGLPMAYNVVGSGDPIVLVAGTGYPGATWHPDLVGPLAERHAVLTFDHRGTGATPLGRERLSTRLMAADAVGLMDAVGLSAAHVVGHSMGGRVAQWMALDAQARVRTLVLAATGPGQWNPDKPVTRGIPVHTAVDLVENGYERYMRDHIRATFFTPEFADAHPDRVDWLVRAFWDHRPTLESYLRHVVARQEHETTARLGGLTMPTLILIGDRDTHEGGTGVHWDASEFLLSHLPNAHRVVMQGATTATSGSSPQSQQRSSSTGPLATHQESDRGLDMHVARSGEVSDERPTNPTVGGDMTEDELVDWILQTLAHVDETMNDGNHFFFYNPPGFEPEHLLPFATIVTNNHYDDGSDLDRPGVYRLNVGVGRETFTALFPADAAPVDRTALDAFFPHPDYASMFWLSVINPTTTWPRAQKLLAEAHGIAQRRVDRKHGHAAEATDGAGAADGPT